MDVHQCWEDLLKRAKCKICLRTLEEPKTLPCLHSFCLACLEKLARDGSRRQEKKLNCPVCQSPLPIPEENTFSYLPTSVQWERFKNVMAFANGRERGMKCSNCDEMKTAISYCYVCRDYLCWACDQAHRRLKTTRHHRNILLERVQSLLKKPPVCSVEYHEEMPIDYYCYDCLECLCQVCRDEDHREHDVISVPKASERGKTDLLETLMRAKQEFVALKKGKKETSDIFQDKKKDIIDARRLVETNVDLCIQCLKEHKEAVLAKLDEIYAGQQQAHENKQRELTLLLTQMKSPIEYGNGVLARNLDEEIALEWEMVVSRCEHLLDSAGNTQQFQLPAVTYLADEEMCRKIQRSGLGQVIVRMENPFVPERHQYKRMGEVSPSGYESAPRGVAVSPSTGNILVCNSRNVHVFNSQRQYMRSFGNSRDDTKNLSHPTSVAYNTFGDIIVIDRGTIVHCSSTGVFLGYWGGVHEESTVSIKTFGDLIVCDKSDATVKVLSSCGSLRKSFNIPNVKPSFAIYHEEKFFVSYKEKQCVKVFDENGGFIYDIGARGCDQEKLNSPLGLAIDGFNNLVVCDTERARLQIYNLDGTHVCTVEGESPRLASPEFVAVSREGHLFVTDPKSNCVHVFR